MCVMLDVLKIALKYDFFPLHSSFFIFVSLVIVLIYFVYIKTMPYSNVTIIIYIDVHFHFVVVFACNSKHLRYVSAYDWFVVVFILFFGIHVNTDLSICTACTELNSTS